MSIRSDCAGGRPHKRISSDPTCSIVLGSTTFKILLKYNQTLFQPYQKNNKPADILWSFFPNFANHSLITTADKNIYVLVKLDNQFSSLVTEGGRGRRCPAHTAPQLDPGDHEKIKWPPLLALKRVAQWTLAILGQAKRSWKRS